MTLHCTENLQSSGAQTHAVHSEVCPSNHWTSLQFILEREIIAFCSATTPFEISEILNPTFFKIYLIGFFNKKNYYKKINTPKFEKVIGITTDYTNYILAKSEVPNF